MGATKIYSAFCSLISFGRRVTPSNKIADELLYLKSASTPVRRNREFRHITNSLTLWPITTMKIVYHIINKNDLTEIHRTVFGTLLKEQNKVRGDLSTKAGRCKVICIVNKNDEPIAIGGIKTKTRSDFNPEKANLSELANDFEWELGYLYTKPAFGGQGIASNVVKLLLNECESTNLMASTEISKNPGMVKILERNGFRHFGKPWKSDIHANFLGLYLRFSHE